MKSEIHIIAEAILANTQVLKMLIEKLPPAVAAQVAEKVAEVNPTPAPAPVATPTPAPEPVMQQNPTPAPVAPAVTQTAPVTVTISPVETAPAAPATASPFKHAPFTTQKELISWIMDSYKVLGPTKGAQIQGVMDRIGIKNINDVQTSQYQALFEGVEALKNGA